MSTVHRAKGLEFDHVAVLDGGWDRVGPGEDCDAPRRLYYVAMTRTRQTLTLAHLDGSRSFPGELPAHGAVIRRAPAELPPCPESVKRRYIQSYLKNVDIGFAGRRSRNHSTHRAIAALSVGDPLTVRIKDGHRWELLSDSGQVVGRLAGSFQPPDGMQCRSAEVFAVIGRTREGSEERYRAAIRCDSWEVVLPELVFERAQC
ncbi:MAG: ATP-binding domain-containing protein [Bryobacterales bacterium]|nr:ATP-binding domain-containing protein [Bryobacterales bacterium]